MLFQPVIILSLLLCHCSHSTDAVLYYVHSPGSSPQSCPSLGSIDCHSLSYYINDNTNKYFASNNTFVLLSGVHPLNETMLVKNSNNLTIMAKEGSNATIQCTRSVGISFVNVSSLILQGFTLMNCGMVMTPEHFNESVSTFGKTMFNFTVNLQAALFLNYIYNFTFSDVTISYSYGYGLLAINVLGDSLITRSHFDKNNHRSLANASCFTNISLNCKGGNAILMYTDLLDCPHIPLQYSLMIDNTLFEGGVDAGITFQPFTTAIQRNDVELIGGAGLGLLLMQSSYGLNVNITNVNATMNAAFVGANLYMNVWDHVTNSTIILSNSSMTHGNDYNRFREILEVAGSYTMAPGFFYLYGMISLGTEKYTPVCTPINKYITEVFRAEDIEVSDNEASLNSGGFMYMWPRSFMNFPRNIRMTRAKAVGNNGDATFINFYVGLPQFGQNFKVFVKDCNFSNNFYMKFGNGLETSNPQVYLINSVQYIEFTDCEWFNNSVSSIRPLQTIIYLNGRNRFLNNSANNGAGLNVREGTIVYFRPSSTTIFRYNHANQFGGAIYAELVSYMCFYQIERDQPLPRLIFSGNNATMAGNAVYANLENCLLQEGIYTSDALEVFTIISNFTLSDYNSTSLVSAPASQFCMCNEIGSKDCSENDNNNVIPMSVYPGMSFSIIVQALAYSTLLRSMYSSLGLTPTQVTATIINNETKADLGLTEVQEIGIGCSQLQYRVFSPQAQKLQIILSPQNRRIYQPIIINLTLTPCPVGFVQSIEEQKCVCDRLLSDRNIICNTATETIVKTSQRWIGTINPSGVKLAAVASPFIVNNVAAETFPNFNLSSPDLQCVNHHSGILCGGCLPGYSVTLGSRNCEQCSNIYLLLLLFFAGAAFLLIGFISLLKLTVSTGRINGLLFYANVVKLANSEFFSLHSRTFAAFQILVDWTNLDFSFHSCFYDGFDSYAKAWFQFAFSAYLYFILAMAVIGAGCSTKIAKILPKNILAALTTIVLITFTKLFRASATAFPFANVFYAESSYPVWSIDGNVKYFDAKHAILFLFSLAVLLLLVIPFALIMFFYPFIWSFTAHEGTVFEKFVCAVRTRLFTLKPLLETFDGPYHPKSRYWTGLLLLLRLIIFLIALNSTVFKTAGVTAICIVLLGIVLVRQIYYSPINKRVEFVYLLNLAVLQFILLVLNLSNISDYEQGYAVSASILIAYLTFAYTTVHGNWHYVVKRHYYKFRGKTFVDLADKEKETISRLREEELKKVAGDLDEETAETIKFIDVADARNSATQSVFSIEDKIAQLNEGLLKSN